MAKSVSIDFPLKTPAEMAKRLGISGKRLSRLLAIARQETLKNGTSVRVAFKSRGHAVNSRSARRGNAKTTR